MVWLLWKAVWGFLKKLNTELPDDPAIPLPGILIHPEEVNTGTQTKKYSTHIYSSITPNSQENGNTPSMSIDCCMNK